MSNFEAVLNLSTTNLKERRAVLEQELSKVVVAQVTADLKETLSKAMTEEFSSLELDIVKLSWDFYPESDDEGGSDWWITDVSAYDSNGEYVELEDLFYEKLSYNKSYTYKVDLGEAVREILSDYRTDLYEQDIMKIEL